MLVYKRCNTGMFFTRMKSVTVTWIHLVKNRERRYNLLELCPGFNSSIFYVVRTVHFGMKLYNDQRNAQVFNLSVYSLLPYMFRSFF
jgi:hypothetical protein